MPFRNSILDQRAAFPDTRGLRYSPTPMRSPRGEDLLLFVIVLPRFSLLPIYPEEFTPLLTPVMALRS